MRPTDEADDGYHEGDADCVDEPPWVPPQLPDLRDIEAGELLTLQRPPAFDSSPFTEIIGVRVTDPLELAQQTLKGHLRFKDCWFCDDVTLDESRFISLRFHNCRFDKKVTARGLHVESRLAITKCWCENTVDISGSTAAVIDVGSSTFQRPLPPASFEPENVNRDLALNAKVVNVARSFSAARICVRGETALIGARIGGELNLKEARLFTEPNWTALSLRELSLARSLHGHRLVTKGRVWAPGADIGGELNLSGAVIEVHGGSDSGTNRALDLLSVRTGRWLNLGGKSRFTGSVRLSNAVIGGRISLRQAELAVPPKCTSRSYLSIEAAGLRVERDVIFGSRAVVSSQISMPGAQIGGSLTFDEVTLRGDPAVFAARSTIGGHLRWSQTVVARNGLIDLQDASAARIIDDGSWGTAEAKNLVLSGLKYEALGDAGAAPKDWKTCLDWLRRQRAFDLAPYRVAADALKRQGRADDARKLLVNGERDRLQRGGVKGISRLWGWVLWGLTGVGHRLGRAVIVLLAVVVLTGTYFAHNRDAFSTTGRGKDASGEAPVVTADVQRCVGGKLCFDPWEYAINAAVPGIPLGQTSVWVASGGTRHIVVALQLFGWLFAGSVAAALALLYLRRE